MNSASLALGIPLLVQIEEHLLNAMLLGWNLTFCTFLSATTIRSFWWLAFFEYATGYTFP